MRAVGRGTRALQKVGEEKIRQLPARKEGARVEDEGGAPTGYHHLTLDFKLGVLAGIFEEEVDVSNHGERFDILVCELGVWRGRLQRTRENDESKF